MRFSKHVASIAVFVLAALLVYLIGTLLLGVWPMGRAMWAMMGLRSDPVLLLVVVAMIVGIIAVLAWSSGDGSGADLGIERCPACRAVIAPDYVLCPECHTRLRASCSECGRPLQARWTCCPYCGVEVAAPSSGETRPLGAMHGADARASEDANAVRYDGR